MVPLEDVNHLEELFFSFIVLYTYIFYSFRGPVHLAISTVDRERNEALVQYENQAHTPASLTSLHLHDLLFSDFRASA